MMQVLRNIENNDELTRMGYTVVNFLSPEQVSALAEFYLKNPNEGSAAFHATHFNTNVEYKKKVQQFILDVLADSLNRSFNFHIPRFANFMIKEGGGHNPMPLHADWTYVDENTASSYAVWIPLINITMDNGCIGVIPSSQHLSYHIRGPRILQWTPPVAETLINMVGKLLPLSIGQALIYNHRTLHYSLPNNTPELRPSINISLAPKDESLFHYTVPKGQTEVLKFAVAGDEFYLDYDNFQMPRHGEIVERIPVHQIPMINERVDSFIATYGMKSGIRSYLKKLFA